VKDVTVRAYRPHPPLAEAYQHCKISLLMDETLKFALPCLALPIGFCHLVIRQTVSESRGFIHQPATKRLKMNSV
jgi:hypothetical protein